MADLQIYPACIKKTLATTVNSDFSIMTTTQYMRRHKDLMWIKKPKLRVEYIKYKNNFNKYIERSANFKPCLDLDSTLNKVLLNKVEKGCIFFINVCHTTTEETSIGINRNHIGKIFSKNHTKMLNGSR